MDLTERGILILVRFTQSLNAHFPIDDITLGNSIETNALQVCRRESLIILTPVGILMEAMFTQLQKLRCLIR